MSEQVNPGLCPFCRCTDVELERGECGAYGGAAWAVCYGCGATEPTKSAAADAADAWNEPGEKVAELVGVCEESRAGFIELASALPGRERASALMRMWPRLNNILRDAITKNAAPTD